MSILVKLIPEQVPAHWPLIKNAIFASMPPMAVSTDEKKEYLASFVYQSIMKDDMQVWFFPDDQIPPSHIIVTSFLYDHHTRTSSLCVYANYGVPHSISGIGQTVILKDWTEGIKELKDYGKGCGCSQLIMYLGPENEKMAKLLRLSGFREESCFTTPI